MVSKKLLRGKVCLLGDQIIQVFFRVHSLNMLFEVVEAGPYFGLAAAARRRAPVIFGRGVDLVPAFLVPDQVIQRGEASFPVTAGNFADERLVMLECMFSAFRHLSILLPH